MSQDRSNQPNKEKIGGPGDEHRIQEPSVSLTGEIDIQQLAASFRRFVTVFIRRRRNVLNKLQEFDKNK